ncbi:Hsp33 family molecular chaperone HslO [Catenovulum sp. SM1970]|uniref:Hsp33 family molecular chaperone HslO n=1 Tax=Marinifaba aquimaris TaxID=2741323 RepID=UPI0015716B2F|nr:Hsp33 family molecular chaperone HslO [Marinifaba aquimaris]NTS75832.1 Hsp33 family molecular chaperone HslO [Marinifaba aquimaris]
MKTQDQLHRYLFENAEVRGEIVQLDETYKTMVENHDYPAHIQTVLGHLLSATSLLTATLKFEGDIAVQIQGDGPVKYMSINGTDQQDLRGVARYHQEPESSRLSDVIGKGFLVITITPTQGERYQGVVALEHETLAECLQSYFEQSEQLATKLWLFTDIQNEKAGGMLLQVLPSNADSHLQDFEHLTALTDTVKMEEVLDLDAQDVLYRLYHQEKVQLFEPKSIRFNCGCSRDKSLNAIASINASELESIIEEQGQVATRCEYCLTDYIFSKEDLLPLLQGSDTQQ